MTSWSVSWSTAPRAGGIKLTGEGALLQLTKRILESALKGEIIDGP
ncbi:hypothetical protein C9F11_44840 (plasmid) [Streptomyces sp. YIM 121038]|nr:hypothetical protein [Streptomyces sp. YIM 121038]QCX82530.1 hypothetical protein C9F11_44840 [Streptomyces sp. YIM 121038]